MSDLAAQHERQRLEEHTRRLKEKLRELFQIGDVARALDFGMYRIMHQKRREVEEFIDTTLGRTVDEAFGTYTDDARASIAVERETLERTILEEIDGGALGPEGILPQFLNTKRNRDLNDRWKQLRINESRAIMSDQHKGEIFAHVTEFFSRYYKDGDFLSLPRQSKREKYAIPYKGEEVVLHWVNKDQYYVKTDLWLNNYVFDAGVFMVAFEICQVDNSVNTANNKELVFILARGDDAVVFDQNQKVLTIRFVRAKWNADEMEEFLPEGANREKPTKEHLREAIVNEALTKVTDIGLKAALNKRAYPDRTDNTTTILQQHVTRFTTENTSDFFIHRDLHSFLTRELEFYLKNEVINLDDLGTDREASTEDLKQYMTRARIIKQISTRIIDFLAQMEEFQRKLWEKKKFVLASDYCMTLDYIPEDFYDEILVNEKQLAEWKSLYGAGEDEQLSVGVTTRGITREYLRAHPYLVLDTKFFNTTFKEKLLINLQRPDRTLVQDLDMETSGLMIHSENWQALALLQEKFTNQIKCIYIDPPYNTGNDEFLYKDSYQHSSWLSMLGDRLYLSRFLLNDIGGILINIDDNENSKLLLLLNDIYDRSNFVANIIWEKKYTRSNNAKLFSTQKDYLLFYRKSEKLEFLREPRTEQSDEGYSNPDNDPRGDWTSVLYVNPATKEERPNLVYPIINPFNNQEVNHPTNAWKYSYEEHQRHVRENRLYWGRRGENSYPRLKVFLSELEGLVPVDIWEHKLTGTTDEGSIQLESIFNQKVFTNPKPVRLIKRIGQLKFNKNVYPDSFLDFFAGSGTTAHAVLNLNKEDAGTRKYTLIEMGDYFHTVMKPRIEKVVFASEWKDGKPVEGSTGQSHIFKYQTLEQYEDTLDNIIFREQDGTIARTLSGFSDYMLKYMLGFETQGSACRLNTDLLKKPFEYTLRIRRRKLDADHLKCSASEEGSTTWWDVKVDLVETFNYLIGLHVQRIAAYDENDLHYRVVHGRTRDNGTVTVVWRNSPEGEAALKADERFINEVVKREFPASTLYINGQFFVKGAEHIEPKFRELMGA